jgi:hypothetical protein
MTPNFADTDYWIALLNRREGLTDVLTNDHHFEQEGFRILFQQVGYSTSS